MHQAHFRTVCVEVFIVFHVPCNGIYQCTMKVSHSWVHHKSSRFVHHKQFSIFVNNIQRNVLCLDSVIVSGAIEHQSNHVVGTNFIVTLHRLIVHMHETSLCSLLNSVSTTMLKLFEHKLIHSQRLLTFVGNDAKMFVKLLIFVF